MPTTNILIIGASGFIGQALTKKLLRTKNNIYLTSRDKKFRYTGAKIYHGDLINSDFCRKILKNIDLVYYLAGCKKNLKWHLEQPYEFYQQNARPWLNFLEALKNSRVKKIIYLSTVNVGYFDPNTDKIDGYAFGKYANEIALKIFLSQYPNFNIKIVRPAMVYGPGDNFNPATANFLPAMIDRVRRSEKELIVWGRGARQLQFIYIEDLIENLLAMAKTDKNKQNIYTIGNEESLTVNKIVKLIIKLCGKNLVIKNDLAKPDAPTKLFKFNNPVKPKINLAEGLKRAVNFYQEHYA